jgi:outer membrane protein assembly factor BamB
MHILTSRSASYAACAALFLSLSGLATAAAADWPQFRGPEHNDLSTETGLLKQWPKDGPPLVWQAKGLGDGYSSVAVAGDRLYTAGDKGDSSFVLALNAADGQQVWSAKLGRAGAVGDPKFYGPRSTPTVDGDLVFAVSQWGEMVCLEAAGGKEVWRKDFTKDLGGACPTWGYAESPLADGDRVVVTPGGSAGAVVALNKKTGVIVWRSKEFTDSPHYSSLAVASIGGVRQYIQLTPESVAGIAAADGKLLWRAARKGNVAVIPSPVCRDGLVYVSSGYGKGCDLFKVSAADGNFTAEPVYSNKVMANHHGGVVLVGDCLYGYSDSKGWTCQDLKTGQAKWQDKEKFGKGSLAYADGQLYLRQEDTSKGTVALIEASPEGFKEHGRFNPPGHSSKNSWPHPVIANGKLYLRDQDVLLCYDVKTK